MAESQESKVAKESAYEEKDEDKPKTKKVEKTTWDWVLVNESKCQYPAGLGWLSMLQNLSR